MLPACLSGSIAKSALLPVGAGSLMPAQRCPDQQVPSNSKTHNSLRHPNPPNPIHPHSIPSQNQIRQQYNSCPVCNHVPMHNHLMQLVLVQHAASLSKWPNRQICVVTCRGGFSHASPTLSGSASSVKQHIHQSFLLKLFVSKSLWHPNPPNPRHLHSTIS